MRHNVWTLCVLTLAAITGFFATQSIAPARQAAEDKWAFNATIIEACSCPMFCTCYFDTKPSTPVGHEGHGEHGGCLFNNAFKVNTGTYAGTKLDGAKFWVAGDLGHDFSKGEMNWAVLTFDPSTTKEQREGIQKILGHVYPVTWKSFTVAADKPMVWEASKDKAVAKLDDGKAAEVALKRFPGNTNEPIVINNLKYWGVPRNQGFVLMPNEVQALRQAPEGQQPFEYKGSNGFMITIDINSDDVKK
ncbi:hypothetical protein BH09PLA1_BH09PLA1_28190 [soil metagenome]